MRERRNSSALAMEELRLSYIDQTEWHVFIFSLLSPGLPLAQKYINKVVCIIYVIS